MSSETRPADAGAEPVATTNIAVFEFNEMLNISAADLDPAAHRSCPSAAESAALGSGAAEQQASAGASLLVGANVPLVGSAATLATPMALRIIFSLQVQVKRHPQETLNRCCRMIILATSTTAAAPATVPATTAERCNVAIFPHDASLRRREDGRCRGWGIKNGWVQTPPFRRRGARYSFIRMNQ